MHGRNPGFSPFAAWAAFRQRGACGFAGFALLAVSRQIGRLGEWLYEAKAPFACPICGRRISEWQRYHRMVVPGTYRVERACLCPACRSFERTRAIWLYFRGAGLLQGRPRFLHFAPEASLQGKLKKWLGRKYVTTDLKMKDVSARCDITNLAFADDSFDVIYCSHVLEHIPDDVRAMRELHRVLATGGAAIIQVPLKGDATLEDKAVLSAEERDRRFGQFDHVRLYGKDIAKRLSDCGFTVKFVNIPEALGLHERQLKRFNIGKGESMLLCRKTSAPGQ